MIQYALTAMVHVLENGGREMDHFSTVGRRRVAC